MNVEALSKIMGMFHLVLFLSICNIQCQKRKERRKIRRMTKMKNFGETIITGLRTIFPKGLKDGGDLLLDLIFLFTFVPLTSLFLSSSLSICIQNELMNLNINYPIIYMEALISNSFPFYH